MERNEESKWLEFFRNAGIPPTFDKKYSCIFDENRIKMDMLMDLNKEYLREMGITAMGDIISILKHSKLIYEKTQHAGFELKRDPPTSTTSSDSRLNNGLLALSLPSISTSLTNRISLEKIPILPSRPAPATPLAVTGPTIRRGFLNQTGVMKSSPPSHNSNSSSSQTVSMISFNEPPQAKKRKPIVFEPEKKTLQEEVPVQKKIRVLPEHEGPYKIKMPEGTTPKTQKLLQSRSIYTKPFPISQKEAPKSGIFMRLGGNLKDASVNSSPSTAPGTSVKQSALLRLSANPTATATSRITSKLEPIEPVKKSIFSRLGGISESSSISATSTSPKLAEESKAEVKPELKKLENVCVIFKQPLAKKIQVPKSNDNELSKKLPPQDKIEVRIERKNETSKLYSMKEEPTSISSRLGERGDFPKDTFRVEIVNTQAKKKLEDPIHPPPLRRRVPEKTLEREQERTQGRVQERGSEREHVRPLAKKQETLTTKLMELRDELKSRKTEEKLSQRSSISQGLRSLVVDSRSMGEIEDRRSKVNYHPETTNRRHDDSSSYPIRKSDNDFYKSRKTEESLYKSHAPSREKLIENKRHEASRNYSNRDRDEEIVTISRNSPFNSSYEEEYPSTSRDWRSKLPSTCTRDSDRDNPSKGPKGIIKPIDEILIKHIRTPPSSNVKKGSVKFSEQIETLGSPDPSTSQPKKKSQKIVGRLSKTDGLSNQEGTVLRTERIPSGTKGKFIVKKYVVKKVKKGSSAAAAAAASKMESSRRDRDSMELPDIGDPLDDLFYDSDGE